MRKSILLFVFALVALNVSAKEGLCDFIHCVDEIYYQYIDGAAWVSRKAHYGYEDEVIWDNNCYSGQLEVPVLMPTRQPKCGRTSSTSRPALTVSRLAPEHVRNGSTFAAVVSAPLKRVSTLSARMVR